MTVRSKLQTDILIVGAGPTGLLLANLLGRMGVGTVIVEKNKGTVEEPRAVSIDDESMRALQAAGLSGQVLGITARGYGSVYYGPSGKSFLEVKPSNTEYGFEKRNAFQQPELEALMRDGLEGYPNVQAYFETEVIDLTQDDAGVTAQARLADGQTARITARYAVACDGGRSPTRKALGIGMSGATFEEPWLIVDLWSSQNRCFHTEVFCDPSRAAITLPGPGGIRRYEFKMNKGERVENVENEAFARKLLARFGPDENAPIRRLKVYTFHARMADRWRDRQIFLAGDAAHLTPPFAGQGMNSGLRDAFNLAWKLDEALRSEEPDRLLDSYEIERRPHAWSMIALALRMGNVMMPTSRLKGLATRGFFRSLSVYKPAKDYFAQMKYKPKPRFKNGLIKPDTRPAKETVIGRMFPQPLVALPGRERHLLDDLLPDQPVVLIFDERPEEAISAKLREDFVSRGAFVLGVTPEWTNPIQTDFLIVRDHTGLLSTGPLKTYLGYVLLLRRDRYVMASQACADASALLDALSLIRTQNLSYQAEGPLPNRAKPAPAHATK